MLYLLKTMIMWHITALKTNTITYESCLLLQSCVKQGDLSINQIDTLGDFQLKITQIQYTDAMNNLLFLFRSKNIHLPTMSSSQDAHADTEIMSPAERYRWMKARAQEIDNQIATDSKAAGLLTERTLRSYQDIQKKYEAFIEIFNANAEEDGGAAIAPQSKEGV